MNHSVILFDGICNLCNHSVQFILKRDHAAHFQFAALQSDAGQKLLSAYGKSNLPLDSIILITEAGGMFTESDAAIRIAKHLNGAWPLLGVFLAIPRVLRDPFYRLIARNRYRWFGKKDACMLPSPEWETRFL
jgi:predicted DCC family thiol-disulfide oxidoreductase YuxK